VKSSYNRTTSLFKLLETGFTNNGFTFLKKDKEIGKMDDDFNCNVVLHPNDLSLFYKKNFN